jgi:hypothetical protein
VISAAPSAGYFSPGPELSGGTTYIRLATLDYARDGGPFGAPFLGAKGPLYGLTFDGGPTGIG